MHSLKQKLSYLILGQKGGKNRIQILEELNERPYNLNQLAEKLNLNYRTVKHHIDLLLENELVNSSRTGRYGEVYFLSPEMEKNMDVFNDVIKKLDDFTSSPKFFQNLIEQTNYGIIIVNPNLEVFFWNRSAEDIFGYSHRDIVGNQFPLFPNPRVRDKMIQRAEKGEVVSGVETKFKSLDGELIDVSLNIDPIREDNENLIGYSILTMDITARKKAEEELQKHKDHLEEMVSNRTMELTRSNEELNQEIAERKKAEEELRESRRKLSMLLGNLPGMAYRCRNDRNWTMEFVSEGCRSLTGYQPKDLLDNTRMSYNELIHPDDREMVWNTVQKSVDDKEQFNIKYRIMTRDSLQKWVMEKGQGVFDDNGEPIALEGFITDITDRVKAEKTLMESEAFMGSILLAAPIGIGVVINREFIYVNNRVCEITGYDREELMGSSARMIYPNQEEYERVGRVKYSQIDEEGIGVIETRIKKKNGKVIDVILSSAPIDHKDLSKGVTFTIMDITGRKRIERELIGSENKFRKIVDSLPHMIYAKDHEGKFVLANKFTADALDMDQDEILGKSHLEIGTSKEEVEKFLREDKEVIEKGKSIFIPEDKFTTKDGRILRLQTTKMPLDLDDGKRVCLGISFDITGKEIKEK